MNISEQIQAQNDGLVALKGALVEAAEALDALDDGAEGADELAEQIEAHTSAIEDGTKKLDRLLAAENAIALKAKNVLVEKKPAATHFEAKNALFNTRRYKSTQPVDRLVRVAIAEFEGYLKKKPSLDMLNARFGEDEETKAVFGIVQKAAQNPAMTNVTGWAEELTRESYAAFMDLIAPTSVLPNLPLANYDFGSDTKITVPMRTGSHTADPNLAGAFRAEGAPIRVGSVTLGSAVLTPKSMGVIGSFTMELFKRSTPNIESAIRDWIGEDSAVAIDGHFLGSTARSATHPGGIQNGIDPGDTRVSAGDTAANMKTDARACIDGLMASNLGIRPVWIMHESRWMGVKMADDATGNAAFPETVNGKTWFGYPVVTSTSVPAGVVYLVDGARLAYAGSAPSFLGTEVATIHEEYVAADVKPIVVDGAAAITDIADPVRSLFQTNSAALRMVVEMDWLILQAGAVQTVTSVSW